MKPMPPAFFGHLVGIAEDYNFVDSETKGVILFVG
jgi:hypothetical protein